LLSVRQSARVSLQSRVQAGVFGIVEIFLIEALGQNTTSGSSLRFKSYTLPSKLMQERVNADRLLL
jgi:hypothetical protein